MTGAFVTLNRNDEVVLKPKINNYLTAEIVIFQIDQKLLQRGVKFTTSIQVTFERQLVVERYDLGKSLNYQLVRSIGVCIARYKLIARIGRVQVLCHDQRFGQNSTVVKLQTRHGPGRIHVRVPFGLFLQVNVDCLVALRKKKWRPNVKKVSKFMDIRCGGGH